MTSFLYDLHLLPVLEEVLGRVTRGGTAFAVRWTLPDGSVTEPRAFCGVMHGGYAGEEALEMEQLIEEELLALLPEKHGHFTITVTPEWEEWTTLFAIKDRTMTMYRIEKEPYKPETIEPTIIDGRTKRD
jgi:hypothetical protein